MNITELTDEIHSLAKDKGWWDEPTRSFGESISLIHSEISEALESWRKDEAPVFYEGTKPDGWGVELADALIRILDLMASEGLDAEDIIWKKHLYNRTRAYRHGGKKI